MPSWQDFLDTAPDLRETALARIDSPGVVLVGTIRKDGSPRISPVEPLIMEGRLYLGMMWQSKKALDLRRDPRCAIHSIITRREGDEGEVKLYGRVLNVPDPAERTRYAEAVFAKINWRPEEPYHLFAVEIESAAVISYAGEKQQVSKWPFATRR